MMAEREQQIYTIYSQAMELLSEQRLAYVIQACAGDSDLREQVEALLALEKRCRMNKGGDNEIPVNFLGENALQDAVKFLAAYPSAADYSESSADDSDFAYFITSSFITSRYNIGEIIGEGGMGRVYRAEQLKLKRPVAFKILSPKLHKNEKAIERFRQEAKVIAEFDNPYLVRVYDADETEIAYKPFFYIAMEWVAGDTLAKVLHTSGPLLLTRIANILSQVVDALAAMHERNFVHRDLKPANIMLLTKSNNIEQVKVVDLGLARDITIDSTTTSSSHFYTAAYASPEQICSEKIDPRSDIFSLGVVLYEMLAGERPFPVPALRSSNTPLPSLQPRRAEISVAIENLIEKMLSLNPDERPQSVQEVAQIFQQESSLSPPENFAPKPVPQVDKRVKETQKTYLHTPVATITKAGDAQIEYLHVVANFERRAAGIHFVTKLAQVDQRIKQVAAIARKVAYCFLATYSRQPDAQEFSVTLTLPAQFNPNEAQSLAVPIALAIIGQRLRFTSVSPAIAISDFNLPDPAQYLQAPLVAPFDRHIPLLSSLDPPAVLNGKINAAISSGYTRIIYPDHQQAVECLPDIEVQFCHCATFEELVQTYFGAQWEEWNNRNIRTKWEPPENYIARESLLRECEECIAKHDIVMLRGLPGTGKTELALHLQERIRPRYATTDILTIPYEEHTEGAYLQFFLALGYFLARTGYDHLVKALSDEQHHAWGRIRLSASRREALAELALRGLTSQGNYLLIIDCVEYTFTKGGHINPVWLPFFRKLGRQKLRNANILLISSIEEKMPPDMAQFEGRLIQGFAVEEARAFFRGLENTHDSAARICDRPVFQELYQKTEGNPAALMYIFALHRYTDSGYDTILSQGEQMIVGSDRPLRVGERAFNVRNLLSRVVDLLGDRDYRALRYLSVFRYPVTSEALQALANLGIQEWFAAVSELEAFFLLRRRGTNKYQLYPLAKDLEHCKLRNDRRAYQRCHEQAARYYEPRIAVQANNFLYEETLYHFGEAGKRKKVNELLVKDPRLEKAEALFQAGKYLPALEPYEEYVSYMGIAGCSSATLRNFAICLEEPGLELTKSKGGYTHSEHPLRRAIALYETAHQGGDAIATGRLARLYLLRSTGDLPVTDLVADAFPRDCEKEAWELYWEAIKKQCEDGAFYLAFYQYFYTNKDQANTNYTYQKALDALNVPGKRFVKARFLHDAALFHIENGKPKRKQWEPETATREWDKAQELLSLGMRLIPVYTNFYLTAANISSNTEIAIGILEEGAAETKKNKPPHRGKIEFKLSQIYLDVLLDEENGLYWLLESVAAAPENVDAHFRLAEILYQEKKDYETPLVHINKVLCCLQQKRVVDAQHHIAPLARKIYHQAATELTIPIQLWWEPRNPPSQPAPAEALLRHLRGTPPGFRLAPEENNLLLNEDHLAEEYLEKFTTSSALDEQLQTLAKLRKLRALGAITLNKCSVALFAQFGRTNSVRLKTSILVTIGKLKADPSGRSFANLLEKRGEKDSALHYPAIVGLGELERPETLPYLLSALRNRNPLVRFCAVEALGRIKQHTAITQLEALYGKEGDLGVRLAILRALGRHNLEDTEDYFARTLKNGQQELVRLTAASVLIRSGHLGAVLLFKDYLTIPFFAAKERYAFAILMTIIEEAFAQEREAALGSSEELLTFLLRVGFTQAGEKPLKDSASLCRNALQAACRRPTCLAQLQTMLPQASYDTRWGLVTVLGGLEYEIAISPLTQLLSDPEPSIREAAIEAFVKFNRAEAGEVLHAFARHESNFSVRKKAIEAAITLDGIERQSGHQCEMQSGRVRCDYVADNDGRYCVRHRHLYKRIRIIDLAKKLRLAWRDLLVFAQKEGAQVTHHLNSVTEEFAARIAKQIYPPDGLPPA